MSSPNHIAIDVWPEHKRFDAHESHRTTQNLRLRSPLPVQYELEPKPQPLSPTQQLLNLAAWLLGSKK